MLEGFAPCWVCIATSLVVATRDTRDIYLVRKNAMCSLQCALNSQKLSAKRCDPPCLLHVHDRAWADFSCPSLDRAFLKEWVLIVFRIRKIDPFSHIVYVHGPCYPKGTIYHTLSQEAQIGVLGRTSKKVLQLLVIRLASNNSPSTVLTSNIALILITFKDNEEFPNTSHPSRLYTNVYVGPAEPPPSNWGWKFVEGVGKNFSRAKRSKVIFQKTSQNWKIGIFWRKSCLCGCSHPPPPKGVRWSASFTGIVNTRADSPFCAFYFFPTPTLGWTSCSGMS